MNKRTILTGIVLLLAVSGCALHPGVRHYSHDDQEYYTGTYPVTYREAVHTPDDIVYMAKHTFISHLPGRLKKRLLASAVSLTAEQKDALLASVITAVPEYYLEDYLEHTSYRVNVSLDVAAAGPTLERMFGEIHMPASQQESTSKASGHYTNLFLKEEAIYNDILGSGPGPFTTLYLKALTYQYRNYYKDLNPFIGQLMEQYPDFVNPYFYRIRTLIAAESSDAKRVVDELLRLRPGMAQAHYFKGLLFYKDKDYQAAIDSLTKAILLDKGYVEAYRYRGLSYGKLDMYQSAIADLTKVIETGVYDSNTAYYRARSYYETGRFAEAISDLSRKGLQRFRYAMDLLADAHLANGDYKILIDYYTGKIGEDPEPAYHYARRGEAYYLDGQLESAMNDFETAASKEQYPGRELIEAFNCAVKLPAPYREQAEHELRAYLESHEKIDFDGLIMKHYLNPEETGEDHVIHTLDISFTDKERYQCYLCATYYYFGESHLNNGDTDGARDLFQKSLDTGACCRESFLSRGMLKRLSSF